jgi:sulfite reductase (NADPH) flavoprotein alpha-component
VYPVDNPSFHLPKSSGVDIIMIGAGTGIAPYRGFLQERAATGDRGRNWLLFGNRHFHRDFLYQLDWQAQRKAGLLDRVSLAFSRDSAHKIYVQDRVRTEAEVLFRWLEEGAHLYVCGATEMGEAVHQALIDVVGREGGLAEDAAVEYIDTLRREARYHRDLY